MANIQDLFYGRLLDMLLWQKAIEVSTDFHVQCGYVNDVISNDVTGIVNTILDYSINSASSANYKIECPNQTVEDLLNKWLSSLNDELLGTIPTGISNLAKEYFQELWKGSSFALLRAKDWKEMDLGGNKILVPNALYFANGSSIYVDRPDEKNFVLGSDTYYLDSSKTKKSQIPTAKEEIIIQKNGARWHDEYPIPYLVRNGVYKNHKAIQILSDKGDEVITKALPYLFLLSMGSEGMANAGINYKTADMKEFQTKLREDLEKYKGEKGKLPTLVDSWDKKYSHLIPDFRPILSQDLFSQGTRSILAGLGFIDVIQGITSTRKDAVLNPKPFIAEVNAGVTGFKSILTDLAKLIIIKNIEKHPKLFTENNEITVVSTPLRINIEQIMDAIRSGYVYGPVTIQSYHEALGLDHDQEVERMKKEQDDGLRDLFYPHCIQNTEKDLDTNITVPVPPTTKKQVEKQVEKTKQPLQKAELEEESTIQENLEIAPYNQLADLPPAVKKYPEGAQKVFMEVFNSIYNETHDESRAFAGAWSKLKKWMDRHGDKRATTASEISDERVDKLIKLEKIKLLKGQKKLIDKLTKEEKNENL